MVPDDDDPSNNQVQGESNWRVLFPEATQFDIDDDTTICHTSPNNNQQTYNNIQNQLEPVISIDAIDAITNLSLPRSRRKSTSSDISISSSEDDLVFQGDQLLKTLSRNNNIGSCSYLGPKEIVKKPETTNPTKQHPQTQAMHRDYEGYDRDRIPANVFSTSVSPGEWSVASNESLFSLHIGNASMGRDQSILLGADFQRHDELPKSSNDNNCIGEMSETSRFSGELARGRPPIAPNHHHHNNDTNNKVHNPCTSVPDYNNSNSSTSVVKEVENIGGSNKKVKIKEEREEIMMGMEKEEKKKENGESVNSRSSILLRSNTSDADSSFSFALPLLDEEGKTPKGKKHKPSTPKLGKPKGASRNKSCLSCLSCSPFLSCSSCFSCTCPSWFSCTSGPSWFSCPPSSCCALWSSCKFSSSCLTCGYCSCCSSTKRSKCLSLRCC